MNSGSFKNNVTCKLFAHKPYIYIYVYIYIYIYIYIERERENLALNNPQGLICHKT